MRTMLAMGLVAASLAFAMPAGARKKSHKHKRPAVVRVTPRVHQSPGPSPSEDAAKAEAQLAELRATRDVPAATLSGQSTDREVPGAKTR